METTFDALIAPLRKYLKENSKSIDKACGSRTFLFQHFTFTMIFAYLMQIPSLRKISNKTEYSDTAKKLGISHFPWTTLRDGFTRFHQEFFIKMYRSVLENSNLICNKTIDDEAYAFFILRLKNNMKYEVGKVLNITGKMPSCLKNVTDELIRFTNDKHQKVYRVITFEVLDSKFTLCTNRLDLMTLEIIKLYAYRWQIELLFKFVKRVIGGIHLFNHSPNGVNIQFCLLMIMSVLYLNMRQFCKITTINVKKTENIDNAQIDSIENFNTYFGSSPDKWITSINKLFQSLWKVSSYWIENLKDFIDKPFDYQTIRVLAQ